MKREITQEIRQDDRRKRIMGCGGCLLAALIVLAIPTLYIASLLAKTGFVDVPVLSRALYRPSEPRRTVLPLYGTTPETMYRVLATKVTYDPAVSLATMPVTEAEMTTLLQHALFSSPEKFPFAMKYAQIAIEPEELELYVVSPQKERDATLRMRFRPIVKDKRLEVELHEVVVGNLTLAPWMANAAFAVFGRTALAVASDAIIKVGTPINIELETGLMKFVIAPNVPSR